MKVLGFIFLVFGCGPGAGGRVNETAAERVPRPPKKSKVPGSRFQVEVITKNNKYSNYLSTTSQKIRGTKYYNRYQYSKT